MVYRRPIFLLVTPLEFDDEIGISISSMYEQQLFKGMGEDIKEINKRRMGGA